MKKKIAFALSLLCVAGLFGACGGDAAGSASSQASQSSASASSQPAGSDAAAPSEAAADPNAPDPDTTYKISWVGYQVAPTDENAVMVQKWNELFNVEIDVWNIDQSNADEILNLRFAANEIPDIMRVSTPSNFQKYCEQQVLAAIPAEMMDTYMPKTIAGLESAYPGIMRFGQQDGVNYAIPAEVRYANQFRAPLVYRGDWMEAVGVTETPATIEEFEALMYAFANNDPDGNGQKDTYGLSSTGLDAVYGAFGYVRKQWNGKDGKLVYSSVQPEMKEALALLNKWYNEGVLDPEFITGENKGGYWALSHSFIEGRIGLSCMGSYYHWSPTSFAEAGANTTELEAVAPGVSEAMRFGQPVSSSLSGGVIGQGNMFSGTMAGFGKQLEEDPAKMAKIMEMLEYWCASEPDNYFTAYLGIKGETWDYNEKGVPAMLPGVNTEKLANMGAHGVLKLISSLEYDGMLEAERGQWAIDNGFETGGITSELIVSLPSASKYQTELDKLEDETYIAIITGDKPLDYFDEFVAEWEAAGGGVLVQEANDWYSSL